MPRVGSGVVLRTVRGDARHAPESAPENPNPSVIVAGARTPIGRLLGGLKGFSGAELGSVAIRAALERAGVAADQVDYVVMGQVPQAGTGQISARQWAAGAGVPMSVPGLTVDKVCLSGINAIALADQLVRQARSRSWSPAGWSR